jgi:glycosyltransferase involved in cell wall biosynthesis
MNKVIIIEDSSKSNFGGGQRVTIDFIEVMLSLNKHIFIIDHSKGFDTDFKKNIFNINLKILELKAFGKIENKPISNYSISLLEIFLYPFIFIYNYFQLLSNKYLKSFIDDDTIIYCATKKAFLIGCIISRKRSKIIFHAHNINKKNIFSYFLCKIFNISNTYVIAVSNTVMNSYKIKNITTIYNGVKQNLILTKKVDTSKIRRVAFVGSLITWKGVVDFLDSIVYQKNNTIYYVFGSGILQNKLKNLYEYDKRIIFKGFTNDIKYSYLNEIDILCLPSLDSEACPMSIIEAFSFGIPVITTNIGGQSELVNEDCGILVNTNSPLEISNAINKISKNYEFYSKNALSRYKNFSDQKFNKSITNLFDIL